MKLSRVRFSKLTGLKIFNEDGGQGTIYSDGSKLIKIYPASTEINERLEKISNHGEIYRGLEDFCAVPEIMMEADDGRLFGFQMNNFRGFESLGALTSVPFCVNNKISIRKVIFIFLTLHRLLEQIHSKGFLITDFNDENVMFMLVDKSAPSIVFVDIDSWAFSRPNLKLLPSNKTATFCHPEFERDRDDLRPHHDWYSYATLLARSLIKNDPFNLGILSEQDLIRGTTRQKKGISCWDKRVRLAKEDEIYARRFGSELTSAIHLWLTGNQKGIFPKKLLYDFLDGLTTCKGDLKGKICNLEVHSDHITCPKCGARLPQPASHNRQNHFSGKEDSTIISKLIANNK